jgi:hypothetical protein
MTTETAAPPTCSARVGFRVKAEWPNEPLWCSETVGLTTYEDATGTLRRYCRHHQKVVLRRFPRKEVAACRFCHRTSPILDGTYVRMNFGGDISLVCDDCQSKADDEHPDWDDDDLDAMAPGNFV